MLLCWSVVLLLTMSTLATTSLPDTPCEEIPGIVNKVASKAEEWKSLPVSNKICMLQQIVKNARQHHQEWVTLAQEARGVDPTNDLHGCGMADVEISGPAMLGAYANGLIQTLQHVARTGQAPPPRRTRTIGQDAFCAVTLYPGGSLLDFTETVGLQGELILDGPQPLQSTYRDYAVGGVAGILGAGNYDVPVDVLTQVFLKGRVCIYKPNPVAQATSPVLQKILEPLVTPGYIAFCLGGADVGRSLVQSGQLDEIVVTGSPSTLKNIETSLDNTTDEKDGPDKQQKTPAICSELGGVNPWIVVPGRKWNKGSVDEHARALAWAKLVNNGHVCSSPQVVILAKDWKWRQYFVDRIQFWLGQYPGSPPFYPGSEQTHKHFASLPNARIVTPHEPLAYRGQQSCVLLSNVQAGDEEHAGSQVLRREAFCPVLAEVSLEAPHDDPIEFLQSAVTFSETNLFGSLSAVILMDDQTAKQPQVDEIIAKMKYGIVGINMVPAFAYSVPQLVWGAFPSKLESGHGFLGNSGLYQRPQKTVLKAPFSWIGRSLVSVMPPRKARLVFSRMSTYKLSPNVITQTLLFSALFLGI